MRWDQGSLGQMRVDSLLEMLRELIGLPVVWTPGDTLDAGAVDVVREADIEMVWGMDFDEATAQAFRQCLEGVARQVRRDSEGMGSVAVSAPGRWRWMYAQGTVGPVRVAAIRDLFDYRVRVGVRVRGMPYLLGSGEVLSSLPIRQFNCPLCVEH